MSKVPSQKIKIPKFKVVLCSLFLFFSFLYFASARLIIASNDGSQYALSAALTFESRFAIQSYGNYARYWDYAYRAGNFYSDRPVGTSILSYPFMVAASVISPKDSKLSADDKLFKRSALLCIALLGSATVVLFVLVLKNFQISSRSALIVGFIYGISSLNWKYASLFMSHLPGIFCLTLIIYIITLPKGRIKVDHLFLCAFALGLLPLIRHELIIILPFLLLFAYFKLRTNFEALLPIQKCIFVSLFLLPLLFLAFYQTICFGRPWNTFTSFYAPSKNYWGFIAGKKRGGGFSLMDMLSNDLGKGLKLMFVGWPPDFPSRGILLLHPVLFLIPFGLPEFYRRAKNEVILFSVIVILMVVFSAKNLAISGGGMHDPRYVLPILPILYFPLAFVLDQVSWKSKFGSFVYCILVLLSLLGGATCLVHFIESDGSYRGFNSYFKKISPNSLLTSEWWTTLASDVFLNWSFGFIAPLIGLLMLIITCFFRVFISSTCRLRSYWIRGLMVLLLTLNLLLIFGIYMGIKYPLNKFNDFPDTLKISEHVLLRALQQEAFTIKSGMKELSFPNLSNYKCEDGLRIVPHSLSEFQSNTEDRVLKFDMLVSDRDLWNQKNQAEVEFGLKINGIELERQKVSTLRNQVLTKVVRVPKNAMVQIFAEQNPKKANGPMIFLCNFEFTPE